MDGSRLKIARQKINLNQRKAAELIGITPQAWSSAERGKSKLHRRNLETVAKKMGVSFSWLVTGEGSDSIFMPEDVGTGQFVRIKSSKELLTGERGKETKYIFIPGFDQDTEAMGYSTRSELPPSVEESTFVFVDADFKENFVNGKLYLMAIDELLIIRKIEKVVFGTNKGTYKLSDLKREVDFVKPKGIKIWRVVYRLDKLG